MSAHFKNDALGFVDYVMTAEFQADSLIMVRVIDGMALMAILSLTFLHYLVMIALL